MWNPLDLFEPYRPDKNGWEKSIFFLVGGLLSVRSIEVLIVVVLLLILVGAVALSGWLLLLMLANLWLVYRTHGFSNTRTARILQGLFLITACTWALSFALYQSEDISWEWHSNLIGGSWLAFWIGVALVRRYLLGRAALQLPPPQAQPGVNIRNFLNFKRKKP